GAGADGDDPGGDRLGQPAVPGARLRGQSAPGGGDGAGQLGELPRAGVPGGAADVRVPVPLRVRPGRDRADDGDEHGPAGGDAPEHGGPLGAGGCALPAVRARGGPAVREHRVVRVPAAAEDVGLSGRRGARGMTATGAPPITPGAPEGPRAAARGAGPGGRRRITFRAVVLETIQHVVELDVPRLRTIVDLTRRPGAGCRAYVEGERERSTNPLKFCFLLGALAVAAGRAF